MVKEDINILILEDDNSDAELIERVLKKSEMSCAFLWVKNKDEFEEALTNYHPDVILADYNLPAFNAFQALEIVHHRESSTPFIIVSGQIEDAKALEAMKIGGTDYVLKDKLFKLPVMVKRAIEEATLQKEKSQALKEIQEIHENQKRVFKTIGMTTWEWDVKHKKVKFSVSLNEFLGFNYVNNEWDFEELIKLIHPDDIDRFQKALDDHINGQTSTINCEHRLNHQEEGWIWVLTQGQITSRDNSDLPVTVTGLSSNISKQKMAEDNLMKANRENAKTLALLDTLYKSVPIGLLILDEDEIVVTVNNALSAISGLERNEHIGKTFQEVLPQFAKKSEMLLKRVVKSGRPIMGFEMKAKSPYYKDLGDIYTLVSFYPVINEDYRLICVAINDISKIRWAEDAIFQSEMRFQQMEEHINAVIWMVNSDDNKLRYISPSCFKFLKVSKEQLQDDPFCFLDYVYNEDQVYVEQSLLKFLNSEDPEQFEIEFRMMDQNREFMWMSSKGFAIRDRSGTIISYGTLMQDVTKRKNSEKELLESRNMLLETQNIAHLGSFEWFVAENKVVWSDELYRIFGYIPKEIPSSIASYLKATHPDDSEIVKKSINTAIITGSGFEIEHRIILPDKSIRVVSLIIKVNLNESRLPLQLLGLVQDITDKKQAEDVAQRFGRILDSSQNELYIFSEDNLKYIQASKSALLNLGYTLNELKSLSAYDIIEDADEVKLKELFAPLKSGDKEGQVIEVVHQRKNKTTYPAEVRLQYLRSETPPVFLAEVADISDRKKAQQARYEGQEMERKRIAMEIHDGIGQMLIAVKQRVSNLEYEQLSQDEFEKGVDEIDKILSMTIEEVRRTSNNLAPIVLKKMGIEDAIEMICLQTEKISNIKITFDHKGEKIQADENILLTIYRILQEALNNIVKHSFATQAKVQFFKDEKNIILIIVDNGKGFNISRDINNDSNGLNNMKERATLINGSFYIESNEKTGTYIKVDVPL